LCTSKPSSRAAAELAAAHALCGAWESQRDEARGAAAAAAAETVQLEHTLESGRAALDEHARGRTAR
jgi:hypothetical protein